MHFLLTKKLKYFMTVMEKGCLTKACEDLFITRSPLGKTINELEALLGEKLFLREHGLYQPTNFAQELYEQTLPIYKKLINLEEHFINSGHNRHINIILDSSFPDNIADVIFSSLSKSEFSLHISRKKIGQEDLDDIGPGPDTLLISNNNLVSEGAIEMECYHSSTILLVVKKNLKNDMDGIAKIPLLIRSNMSGIPTGRLTSFLQKCLGFIPRIRYVNGTVFDCLLMMGNGNGTMLLPLKTCELMNISRENTYLIEGLRMKVNYYYRKNPKNKKEFSDIIKHINTLF